HGQFRKLQGHPGPGVLEPELAVDQVGRVHTETDVALGALVGGALHHTVVTCPGHGEPVGGQPRGPGGSGEAVVPFVDRDVGQGAVRLSVLAGLDRFQDLFLVLDEAFLAHAVLALGGLVLAVLLVTLVALVALVALVPLVALVLGRFLVLSGAGFGFLGRAIGTVRGFLGGLFLLALLLLVLG